MISDKKLSAESADLLKRLQQLQAELDDYTLDHFSRINPFFENVVDWGTKGQRYLNDDVAVYDSATIIGDVKMGQHCWIGPQCMIDGSGGLEIGDYCVFATGTHIYTHDTVAWALSGGKMPYRHAPVSIGSRIFVGAQSIILAGASIGDCSLICANATVTSTIPPYSIAAGTPAKIIGKVTENESGIHLEYFKKAL